MSIPTCALFCEPPNWRNCAGPMFASRNIKVIGVSTQNLKKGATCAPPQKLSWPIPLFADVDRIERGGQAKGGNA